MQIGVQRVGHRGDNRCTDALLDMYRRKGGRRGEWLGGWLRRGGLGQRKTLNVPSYIYGRLKIVRGIEVYDDAFVQLRQTYKNACTRGIVHGSLHVHRRLMCPHAAPHWPRMVEVQCGGVGEALERGTAEAFALGAVRQPR